MQSEPSDILFSMFELLPLLSGYSHSLKKEKERKKEEEKELQANLYHPCCVDKGRVIRLILGIGN